MAAHGDSNWGETLDRLGATLRLLHRALVDVARKDYVPIDGPFDLLHLLMTDPHFAWLRPLSELLAELDELGRQPVDRRVARAVRVKLEALIGPVPRTSETFHTRYVSTLQDDARIASMHAEVRALLTRLPGAEPDETT